MPGGAPSPTFLMHITEEQLPPALAEPLVCRGQLGPSQLSEQARTGFSGMLSAGFIGEKCPLLHFLVSFSTSRFFFFHSTNDCNRILFFYSQLLAISNLIQSGLGTEFNTFLPLRGCC